MNIKAPIPYNELDRLANLSNFNLDYSNFDDSFKDLTRLAAGVAGTSISLVNIVDSFTQWTISNHGFEVEQMPREDSVCQYTILGEGAFEVKDLSKDERFKSKIYVTEEPNLKYYYGTPLKSDGYNIGSLCVLDQESKSLSPEKMEMLQIIGEAVVNRLKAFKIMESLRNQVDDVTSIKNKVVHDIRSPLSGIIGLSKIIIEQGKDNKMDEVLELIALMNQSANSILELTNDILNTEKKGKVNPKNDEYNLIRLQEKLEKLYAPQALAKNLDFTVQTSSESALIGFSKSKLLQIIGNLISNAIKFTPAEGTVAVNLDLQIGDPQNSLIIRVTDSGIGLDQHKIDKILHGQISSTTGTDGEQGYGFGLELIRSLVDSLNGTMEISSTPQDGACFQIRLPQEKL